MLEQSQQHNSAMTAPAQSQGATEIHAAHRVLGRVQTVVYKEESGRGLLLKNAAM